MGDTGSITGSAKATVSKLEEKITTLKAKVQESRSRINEMKKVLDSREELSADIEGKSELDKMMDLEEDEEDEEEQLHEVRDEEEWAAMRRRPDSSWITEKKPEHVEKKKRKDERRIAKAAKLCDEPVLRACEHERGYCMIACQSHTGKAYTKDKCLEQCGSWCDLSRAHMWATVPLTLTKGEKKRAAGGREAWDRMGRELREKGRFRELEVMLREHMLKCVCVNRMTSMESSAEICYKGSAAIPRGKSWCQYSDTSDFRKIYQRYSRKFKKIREKELEENGEITDDSIEVDGLVRPPAERDFPPDLCEEEKGEFAVPTCYPNC